MSRLFVGATVGLAIAFQVAFRLSEEQPAGLRLRAGACFLLVDVADTPTRRETGLSHTAALRADGLLLRWPRPSLHAIWMRDMAYPLDLAWLDADDVVRAVLSNAPPCTAAACPIYAPPGAASSMAVLEVAAGRLAACGVRVGDSIQLASSSEAWGR